MDEIDKAVQKTEPPRMVKIQFTLATNKPVEIIVPADMDALDALCIQRGILDIFDRIVAQRANSGIFVPPPGLRVS